MWEDGGCALKAQRIALADFVVGFVLGLLLFGMLGRLVVRCEYLPSIWAVGPDWSGILERLGRLLLMVFLLILEPVDSGHQTRISDSIISSHEQISSYNKSEHLKSLKIIIWLFDTCRNVADYVGAVYFILLISI